MASVSGSFSNFVFANQETNHINYFFFSFFTQAGRKDRGKLKKGNYQSIVNSFYNILSSFSLVRRNFECCFLSRS